MKTYVRFYLWVRSTDICSDKGGHQAHLRKTMLSLFKGEWVYTYIG